MGNTVMQGRLTEQHLNVKTFLGSAPLFWEIWNTELTNERAMQWLKMCFRVLLDSMNKMRMCAHRAYIKNKVRIIKHLDFLGFHPVSVAAEL